MPKTKIENKKPKQKPKHEQIYIHIKKSTVLTPLTIIGAILCLFLFAIFIFTMCLGPSHEPENLIIAGAIGIIWVVGSLASISGTIIAIIYFGISLTEK